MRANQYGLVHPARPAVHIPNAVNLRLKSGLTHLFDQPLPRGLVFLCKRQPIHPGADLSESGELGEAVQKTSVIELHGCIFMRKGYLITLMSPSSGHASVAPSPHGPTASLR